MSNQRLISIQLEKDAIERINQRLGELSGRSPSILKKEINKAAERMKKSLSTEAKKKYVNTNVDMFRQAMNVEKATVGKLSATIKAKGRPESLVKFKIAGGGEGQSISAKVLRKSQLEELTNKKAQPNIKSFIVKFKSGRIAVVQRAEKEKIPARSKLGRRYIRELKGPSIPHMLGLRSLPESVKTDTLEQLHKDLDAHIAKMLGG